MPPPRPPQLAPLRLPIAPKTPFKSIFHGFGRPKLPFLPIFPKIGIHLGSTRAPFSRFFNAFRSSLQGTLSEEPPQKSEDTFTAGRPSREPRPTHPGPERTLAVGNLDPLRAAGFQPARREACLHQSAWLLNLALHLCIKSTQIILLNRFFLLKNIRNKVFSSFRSVICR